MWCIHSFTVTSRLTHAQSSHHWQVLVTSLGIISDVTSSPGQPILVTAACASERRCTTAQGWGHRHRARLESSSTGRGWSPVNRLRGRYAVFMAAAGRRHPGLLWWCCWSDMAQSVIQHAAGDERTTAACSSSSSSNCDSWTSWRRPCWRCTLRTFNHNTAIRYRPTQLPSSNTTLTKLWRATTQSPSPSPTPP